jgi:hypothetical protein
MGAWGTAVFDNDNAADFAGSLEYCSTTEARTDLLTATLRALIELEDTERWLMAGDFEFPYEIEHALAAAAFVADRKNGREEFINVSYAQGHDRETDTWYTIPLDEPTPTLINDALTAVEKILRQMEADKVEDEWQASARKIFAALLA